MAVPYNENPKISDVVSFDLITTVNDEPIDPYQVTSITIYFMQRSFWNANSYEITQEVENIELKSNFNEAIPVASFGSDDEPAWLSTDPDNGLITHETEDSEGDPQEGHFQLLWKPNFAREGDYFLCYTWKPTELGDSISKRIDFYLFGDTEQTTSIPTHFTNETKYKTLLDLYTPEMFKVRIIDSDLTPTVIDRFNQVVADGFTGIENLTNQILDLLDANAVHETILPYLARFFDVTLRTHDITLWRRQIKSAIPLYKKKGTIGGLTEGLAQAQANLVKFTRYWQTISKYTWQDGFIVTSEQAEEENPTFTLSKLAGLPVDSNYLVRERLPDDTDYATLDSGDVVLSNSDGVTTATWQGADNLTEGQLLLIRYTAISPPTPGEQTIETYVQGLPLADDRDEFDVTYPLKNWNVRLVAEDDALLSSICDALHPFHEPVVFGRIRTVFPFSENIYNMEEYNGSTRDSTDPNDLDKDFLDECSCCMSSKYSLDVEIENLSNDRIQEVEKVAQDFVPFHAQLHSINYTGAFNEFVSSPAEVVEVLVGAEINQNVIFGQSSFNRVINNANDDSLALNRNMLADSSTVGSASTGVGTNLAVVLYGPGVHFDTIGVREGNNLLEILSGTHAGSYTVTVSGQYTIDINESVSWPLSATAFTFRLSNLLYSNATATIHQDNLFTFSDESIDFLQLGTQSDELGTPWTIVVTAGPHAGTYDIEKINHDMTLEISGWSGSGATGLSYNLKNGMVTVASSTTGVVTVTNRGRVVTPLIQAERGISQGDYLLVGGTQYQILNFIPRPPSPTQDEFYISGYSGGTVVGSANIKIYKRLVDNAVGYVSVRGMKLTTVVNYESTLGVANGENPIADPLENNRFVENFLVLIGSNYYQIAEWDANDITIVGPMLSWGISPGTSSISFSIVQFTKTSPIYTEDGIKFDRLDRRNDGVVIVDTETDFSTAMRASVLNSSQGHSDNVGAAEHVWLKIQYKDKDE